MYGTEGQGVRYRGAGCKVQRGRVDGKGGQGVRYRGGRVKVQRGRV